MFNALAMTKRTLKQYEVQSDGPFHHTSVTCKYPNCFTVISIHNKSKHFCFLHQARVNRAIALREEGHEKWIPYIPEGQKAALLGYQC